MTTFIYIKTHNITGLKYFGKTNKTDICLYEGSGKYWKNHIKKHGYNCRTKVVRTFTNMEDCRWWCMKFSIINNIVESNDWANLIMENGLDGWVKGVKRSEETKRKMSMAKKGKMGNHLKKHTEDTKRKISEKMKLKKHTKEHNKKISETMKGRKRGKYKKRKKIELN